MLSASALPDRLQAIEASIEKFQHERFLMQGHRGNPWGRGQGQARQGNGFRGGRGRGSEGRGGNGPPAS
jgi:hypothetical protein